MKLSIAEALGFSLLGIVVVFVMLVFLMGVIWVMGKIFSPTGSKSQAAPAPAAPSVAAPVPSASLPTAPGTLGQLDLHNVDDRTAAMLMAIVADKTGLPLCELRFKSIKEI